MSCWKSSYDEQTYKQPAQSSTKKHTAYADDIDIIGRSTSAVRNAYLALEGEAVKVDLKINEQKTKYMIAARNDRTIRDVGQSVTIGDKHFEVVKESLESLMTHLEIQRKIQTANRCFFGLRKHLQSSHLSHQTKFTIHKTLIRSVLLYGNETWVLTKREENQLLVFERKVLQTICGLKIENGVYRKKYNHELEREFDSLNVLNITKTSKPNRRINQGRPKSQWADGVNSDSLALWVRDWTHCAQDRQTWRDLLQQALTTYWW
jgi:hypothetical protein